MAASSSHGPARRAFSSHSTREASRTSRRRPSFRRLTSTRLKKNQNDHAMTSSASKAPLHHAFIGVTKLPSGRYRARIKDQSLGTFDTAEEAALAHDRAAISSQGSLLHGTSSSNNKLKLNFPAERVLTTGVNKSSSRDDDDDDDDDDGEVRRRSSTPAKSKQPTTTTTTTTTAATPEQAAKKPLPPTPDVKDADAPPSSSSAGGAWGGMTCARQAMLALLFLVAALVAAPPGGGGGGRGGGGDSSSSSSAAAAAAAAAERQPSCAAAAAEADVATLTPPRWEETASVFMDAVRETAHSGFGGGGGEMGIAGVATMMSGAGKGPVLMLVAEDADEARRRAGDVAEAFKQCAVSKCVLTVDCDAASASATGAGAGEEEGAANGESLSSPAASRLLAEQEARGALQKTLVTFLERCPRGLVIVRGAESLSPPLVPALIPALSEGGRYMRDGKQVRADLATYVVTAALSGISERGGDGGEDAVSERNFARLAKDALATVYGGGGGGGEGGRNSAAVDDGVAVAFRRRIDFVAPFR